MAASTITSTELIKAKKENNILPYFWILVSEDEEERLTAANDILSILSRLQADHLHAEDSSEKLCKELEYTLQRLVKGLASFRKAARLGFSILLAEVLRQFEETSCDNVLELAAKHLVVTHSAKSEEKRNNYIGQVFANLSIISSGRLFHKVTSSKILPTVVNNLYELSKQKSFLREIATRGIVDIIGKVSFKTFMKTVLPILKDDLDKGWKEATSEILMIVLCVERVYQKQAYQKALSKEWGSIPIFCVENYQKMAAIVQNSISTHPRVHSIWEEILHHLFNCKGTNPSLEKFWKIVIDDVLLNSSHEKKYLVLKIVEIVLSKVDENQIKIIFSKTFLRTFINALSSSENYLHQEAKSLVKFLEKCVDEDDSLRSYHIIEQLVGSDGHMKFDSITQSKTVQSLTAKMQLQSLVAFLTLLKNVFNYGYDSVFKTAETVEISQARIWVVNQILSLVKSRKLAPSDEDWITDILQFLFFHSYFIAKKDISDSIKVLEISDITRNTCRERFLSCIAEVSNRFSSSKSTSKQNNRHGLTAGVMNNGYFWGHHVLILAEKFLQSEVKLVQSLTSQKKEIKAVIKKLLANVRTIHQKASTDSNPEDMAFEILLSNMGLMVFENTGSTVDVIEELEICYSKLSQEKRIDDANKNGPLWIEVLTEILLSVLTNPSNMLRSLCNIVFGLVCKHLTKDGLKSILDVVDPQYENSQESAIQVEPKEVDDEYMSDEESVESESMEEDEEEEVLETVDEKFRQEVRAILGDAADEDEGSDDSAFDFDDETMLKLDGALAAAFKKRMSFLGHGKIKKETKRTLTYYKLRVLDLIEILIKRCPSSPLIIDLVVPLLRVAKMTKTKENKEFVERTVNILKTKICKITEYDHDSDTNVDHVLDVFNKVGEMLLKSASQVIFDVNSNAFFFLIRMLCASDLKVQTPSKIANGQSSIDSKNIVMVQTFIRRILQDFMTNKRTKVITSFFTKMTARFPEVAFDLMEDFLQSLKTAVNSFRKAQASVIICSMLANIQSHDNIKSSMHKYCQMIEQTSITLLNEASTNSAQLKRKHMKEILKMILKYTNFARNNSEICTTSDLHNIKDAIDQILNTPEYANLKGICNNILAAIARDPQQKLPRKRKRNADNNPTDNS